MGDHIAEYFRSRLVIYALVVSILSLGLVAGGIAVGVVDSDSRTQLSGFLDGYLTNLAAGPETAGAAPQTTVFLEAARGAAIPWLLGLTVIGGPLVLALVFLRGFALGFTLTFLFHELSYKGILVGIAGVLPQSMFAVPGIVLASGAAITFSISSVKLLAGRRSEGSIWGHFVTTTILCTAAGLLIAVATWVQGNIAPILVETVAGYVNF